MIVEEIRKAFKKMQQEHSPKKEGEVYVTDLLHCVLRPKREEPETSIIRGVALHEGLEKLLTMYGEKKIEFEKEVRKQYGDYTLIGRLDGLTEDNIVIEFKTVAKPPDHPYEEHIFQVLIYMNMVNATKGVIVYVGNNEMREFIVEDGKVTEIETGQTFFSQYHVDDEWIKRQIEMYMTKTLIAPFNECRYCELRKSCQFSKVR
ncbi:putative nuclease [Betalipothrixvirus acidiani]|uniref:Nuclease n=1 Tax=Betalipothrixvirus acidiani TaxID=346881 RepID=A7WK97_9VIRU|nr:CRISPR/Cas system associated [Acidianus filamentous virus 3]CAJ31498.1 putative nuclease [Acidianus filamentous virus 3]